MADNDPGTELAAAAAAAAPAQQQLQAALPLPEPSASVVDTATLSKRSLKRAAKQERCGRSIAQH